MRNEELMMNMTEKFVEYLFAKTDQISDIQRVKAQECLNDYEAVTIAGARKNRTHWAQLVRIIPKGSATIIGYPEKTDSKTAALINGFNAHTLELDDGQRFAMIHLGASIISAIKAAADENSINKKDICLGIIMGYEAACRIAIAMQPSHKNLGYHAAGTCGTIGSAVGAAFAMGMNHEQMKRVLTCASGSAAGMLEIQEQESELKPYNLGRAAMDGLTAAYMGLTDFHTPEDMIGGDRGFLKIFSSNYDIKKLTEQTEYFEIERIYVKPYASCRHSHSAVEAAINLHQEVNCDNIEKVIVETYKLGVKGHDHTIIQSIASAKLSTPYAVAVALLYGRADITMFEPLDLKAVDLARKIIIVEKEELSKECPNRRVAIVSVFLKNGEMKESRVDYAKGEPENPLTIQELQEKYDILIQG